MIDPKPLFGEEDETAPYGRGVAVQRLDLGEDQDLKPKAVIVSAVGLGEFPGLAQAMDRGMATFPEILRKSGYLVRNNLTQLLPLDFEKLASFGGRTLEQAATLIGEVASLNGRLHEVDAEGIIARVVESARAHAARKHQALLGLLSGLAPFDARAAEQQVAGLHRALMLRLEQATATSEAMRRLQATLSVEVTTLAILEDMSDHGALGDVLARRAALFKASLQELAAALGQVDTLRLQVQEWTMRCDEVCAVTLPALGYTASL